MVSYKALNTYIESFPFGRIAYLGYITLVQPQNVLTVSIEMFLFVLFWNGNDIFTFVLLSKLIQYFILLSNKESTDMFWVSIFVGLYSLFGKHPNSSSMNRHTIANLGIFLKSSFSISLYFIFVGCKITICFCYGK